MAADHMTKCSTLHEASAFLSQAKNRHLPILPIPLLNQNRDHITSSKEIVAACCSNFRGGNRVGTS